jgi:glycosyltransferase involved in cell wall biosynthesis
MRQNYRTGQKPSTHEDCKPAGLESFRGITSGEKRDNNAQKQYEVIERPNPKYASNIELLDSNFTDGLTCAKQQFADQERTEKSLENLATGLGIAEQVTFWGQQLDVAPFFSAADALIMSSKSEGLPISLLQGFSLGLPAIVTDAGGMAEVVRLAEAKFRVSATDPAEMAAAFVRMAGNKAERKQFLTNAEATFHSRFTLQTTVDAYMDLYRNAPRAF